ncbi:MAG TPA: hypothetical protein VIH54_14430, partial [Chthoniobacterales bacterium]
ERATTGLGLDPRSKILHPIKIVLVVLFTVGSYHCNALSPRRIVRSHRMHNEDASGIIKPFEDD